jgi:5'-3' exonuclease
LCGCDYGPKGGIPGVGLKRAMELLSLLPNHGIIDRMKRWKHLCETVTISCDQDTLGLRRSKRHQVREPIAAATRIAHSHLMELTSLEKSIVILSVKIQDFPRQEIIDAFNFDLPDSLQDFQVLWTAPSFDQFEKVMMEKLGWEDNKCFEGFCPIWIQWNMVKVKDEWTHGQEAVAPKPLFLKAHDFIGHVVVQWKHMNREMTSIEELRSLKSAFPSLQALWKCQVCDLFVDSTAYTRHVTSYHLKDFSIDTSFKDLNGHDQ